MVTIKSENEIALMKKAGEILAGALELIEKNVKPGVTTKMLDKLANDYIIKHNALPSFKGYSGYPASICASVNEEVVHGIPGKRRLNEGDIIGIDIGVCYAGYHADAARTYGVGKISDEAQRLIDVTKESFFKGISPIQCHCPFAPTFFNFFFFSVCFTFSIFLLSRSILYFRVYLIRKPTREEGKGKCNAHKEHTARRNHGVI